MNNLKNYKKNTPLSQIESARRQNLIKSHTIIQKKLIKWALPPIFILFLAIALSNPVWQNITMLVGFLGLTVVWIYSKRLTDAGKIDTSVLYFSTSVILFESLALMLIKGNSGPVLLTCMITITYASQFSKKFIFINAATTGEAYLLSAITEMFDLYPQRPPSLIGDTLFVLLLLPVGVYMLISMQNFRGELLHEIIMLTDKQQKILHAAKNVTATISKVVLQLQELSTLLASQLTEQAAAISENGAIFKNINDIADTTAREAIETKHTAESTVTKSQQGISQLQQVKNGFNLAIGASEDTKDGFQELAKHAENIDEVMRLNREIAAQIKILAVNAGIQAAKAGKAGVGFNVVATKLKSMIVKTEKTLEDSRLLLEDIQIKAREGATAISLNSKRLQKNYEDLDKSSIIIEELGLQFKQSTIKLENIASSAKEQQSGIIQVNIGLEQITIAANELGNQAQTLVDAVNSLSISREELDTLLN